MSVAEQLHPAEVMAAAKRARSARIRLARTDAASFTEYVLRHEKTGKPIQLAPMHEEWHREIDTRKRLMIWSHVEAGKTQQISVGRTLFELGRDPSLRCVVVSSGHGGALKIVRTVSQYIERSRELRAVFPHLKPGYPWTQVALTVERPVISKDPSLQALGVHGDIIGSRIDRLILDDVLDYENTRSPDARKEMIDWFLAAFGGRLTEDACVWACGNAFYEDDLYHHLAEALGYRWLKYPVLDDTGAIRFPQQWSQAKYQQAIDDLGGLGHPEVDRQLHCKDRTDASSRCQEGWIQQCLARGEGIDLLEGLTPEELATLGTPADGAPSVHVGVDIGVKRHKRAGKSVVFVILAWPKTGERQLVWLHSGRWGADQIVRETLDAVERFSGSAHVEDNGAQDFILQATHGEFGTQGDEGFKLSVLPFHTGGNKTHPVIGVESVFSELARSRWIIPSVADPKKPGKLMGATPEIREWIGEMLSYRPEAHTGDHLMASWFAKEGARLHGAGSRTVGLRIVGEDVADSDVLDQQAHPSGPRRAALKGWEALLKGDRR